MEGTSKDTNSIKSMGFVSAVLTAAVGAATFAIAILTPPISGPFSTGASVYYPYTDIISRFPRDYIWMYPAMLLLALFVMLAVCIYQSAPERKKVFGMIGLSFALMSSALLLTDYFVQVTVIQPSLLNGETDVIAMLSQYNPHGIFIALEELGYLLMSLSFLFLAFVLTRERKLDRAIRVVFIAAFTLTILSLGIISAVYGIHREYIFEVVAISIEWTGLIVSGILLAIRFKRG